MSCLSFFGIVSESEKLRQKYYSGIEFAYLRDAVIGPIWGYVQSKVEKQYLDQDNYKLATHCYIGIGASLPNTKRNRGLDEEMFFIAGRPDSIYDERVIDNAGVIPEIKLSANIQELQKVVHAKKLEYEQKFKTVGTSAIALSCFNTAINFIEKFEFPYIRAEVTRIIKDEYILNRWDCSSDKTYSLKIWSYLSFRNAKLCEQRRQLAEDTVKNIASITDIAELKALLSTKISENQKLGSSRSTASLDIILTKAFKFVSESPSLLANLAADRGANIAAHSSS